MKFAAIAASSGAVLLLAASAVHSTGQGAQAQNAVAEVLNQKAQTENQKEKTMKVSRITPVLFAANIEPCVKFWTERLGFQKTAEVPEGNTLGFAILEKDGVELMYQSYASADKDNASTGPLVRKGPSFLYVEVSDLDAVIGAMKGIEPAIPVRTTFYGMREMGVKDPAGHIVMFAAKTENGAK